VQAMRSENAEKADWLVYADWLTDQGDVRGDYLRARVPLLGLSDEQARGHASAGQLEAVERAHLMASAWWLRMVGLEPLGGALIVVEGHAFHSWSELRWRRRR